MTVDTGSSICSETTGREPRGAAAAPALGGGAGAAGVTERKAGRAGRADNGEAAGEEAGTGAGAGAAGADERAGAPESARPTRRRRKPANFDVNAMGLFLVAFLCPADGVAWVSAETAPVPVEGFGA